MAYATREIDHEKRKNGEGSYSPYNHIYRYLMDNYEPEQIKNMSSDQYISIEQKLIDTGKEYCLKCGQRPGTQSIIDSAKKALNNFVANNGEHGDTAQNLGKTQNNSFNTIRDSLADLRW